MLVARGTALCAEFPVGIAKYPIAHSVESSAAEGADGSALQRVFGFGEAEGSLPAGDDGPVAAAGRRLHRNRTGHRRPQVADQSADRQASLLAIPVISEGRVCEVVALHF